jgi:hypothetical protein
VRRRAKNVRTGLSDAREPEPRPTPEVSDVAGETIDAEGAYLCAGQDSRSLTLPGPHAIVGGPEPRPARGSPK